MKIVSRFIWILLASIVISLSIRSQEGRIVREILHGRSLETTITKELSDRSISIYLPASYDKQLAKRYPVIYLLHGIGDTDETWLRAWGKGNEGYSTIKEVMDRLISENRSTEMIVVMPDNKTHWMGSFYLNSVVTGNWEDFNTQELIRHIDAKYRTLARAENRGVLGHSMGGFGALAMGMKHPEIYSAVYGMNPAIIDFAGDLTIATPAFRFILKAKTPDEVMRSNDIYNIGLITVGQAIAPNPTNPPFYIDLPYKLVNDRLEPNEAGFAKWRDGSLVRMALRYQTNLRKLRGLRFDSGYEDEFRFIPVNSRALSNELTNLGISHVFEEYNGDHRNRLWGRQGRLFSEILPWFSEMLSPK